MRFSARETVRTLLANAMQGLVADGTIPAVPDLIPLERPKRTEHGDFASNVALAVGKGAGRPPRDIADAIVKRLTIGGESPLAEVTIAGPGFINLRLSNLFWQRSLAEVLKAGAAWGQSPARPAPKIVLEYLSANPTGPMHVAHGRHAAVGDALARLLRFAGYAVTCEFYVNDAGNQVQMLALSVWARYMESARAADPAAPEVAFPENGYKGDYIRGFGADLFAREGGRWLGAQPPVDLAPIKSYAIERCLDLIRATLTRFDVRFDLWQSERALHNSGDVDETLRALDSAGYIERREQAVWLKTTVLWGDDKDRVVVKSDGLPTYLLADIAYHRKKLARGFDELCDIWGADHHGHIAKMRAALKAFGFDPAVLRVILIQMVSLLRDGKPVAMGKREGEFVTLDEVIDEVGKDATRFFYLMRRHDTPLEFDLELAKRQSLDNPVYYAQYAHARCASILRRADEVGAVRTPLTPELAGRLNVPEEIAILRRLCEFPDFVADAAAAREPHRLTTYLLELAGEFQSYYTRLQKVHGDTILPQERQRTGDWRAAWDWQKTAARLAWVEAIAQVMKNGLHLLGVSAPESMQRASTGPDPDDVTKEDES
ncbi:MAG TPA: arginine--tRNA ligase [Polyangia bacterium]|jgi:arginyl-tRNA synthetase|nr:arginine--tRNA ligase [Polyangia bacterium]